MASSDDKTSLLSDEVSIESPKENIHSEKQHARPIYLAYKRRWYILMVFTAASLFTNILWNQWPPIQETCRLVFWWTDRSVLIIGILSALGSLFALIPTAWIIRTQGLCNLLLVYLIYIGHLFTLDLLQQIHGFVVMFFKLQTKARR